MEITSAATAAVALAEVRELSLLERLLLHAFLAARMVIFSI